ncbi:voltage-dependent anion-selective channel [Novymonas esmeraldas]|uniref:Voltage-dependent anion-selective channel n=1 Tax=Novymonas esmeraldas TaxID=1808958 RepID=A0AAW0F101_9TRYP
MATLYKDFSKDSKDLLTKNFTNGGDWKIENKAKAAKGDYAVATTSTARGDVTVEVEGLTRDGAAYGKLSFTPKDLNDVKATVRAENFMNYRIEAIIAHKGATLSDTTIELNSQTVKPFANGRVSVHDKLTQRALEVALSVAAVEGVQLGCGTKYDLKSQTLGWTAGCRLAARNGIIVTAQTDQLRSYTADVIARAALHPKFQPRVAAAVTLDPQTSAWDGSLALEWGCQVIQGNTAKARLNKKLEWAVSYIANLNGGWSLALSIDKSLRTGLTLTRN